MMSIMNWLVPAEVPLPLAFQGFDPKSGFQPAAFEKYERHLPHWRLAGACYFTTFRLNDSIPVENAHQIRVEAAQWKARLAQAGTQVSPTLRLEWIKFQRDQLIKVELLADECHGECLLRHQPLRRLVSDALHYFEGVRSETFAFVIMPNHVHVLCRPLAEFDIESLSGSWKRHCAIQINREMGRKGKVWQQETFDRIIRDAEHFRRMVRYIAENPVKAGVGREHASVWFCEAIRKANGWHEMEG